MRTISLLATLLVALPAPSPAQSAVLSRLMTATHERTIDNSIQLQSRYGRTIERLPSVSLAADEADAKFASALLDTLKTLDRAKLTPSEQVSAATLDWMLQGWIQAPKFYWLSFASITPYQSPLMGELLFLGRDMALDTPEHRDRFLARLSEIGPLADSIRLGLEARATRGIRLNQAEVQQVIGALRALKKPGTSSPYSPSPTRLEISADAALGDKIAKTIDDKLNPALGRLIDYLGGDYLAKAPTEVGLKQYPGGEEYYRYLVGRSTTLDLTPEEIHQRGLDHLAKLETSMDSLLRVIGFKGTRKEFLAAMNRDPRFRAKTPEEVGARYQKYYEAIKPLVPQLFSRVPRAPGEFRRLNPALEGSQTYGFYQAPSPSSPVGIYFYNASHLETRSLFSVANIAYHELVPGHHFQISLAQENRDLPPLRRDFGAVAFNEGWAEYASGLAGELGLFSDPYDLYGRLISEAFLTTRLVVDPAMNLLGWSREKAMQFMRDHTMMAESEIQSESLRYSVDMPAQALGYKIGAFEFWRLRARAEQALGEKFDVPEFHSLILDAGALPMKVVGEMVDRWIASR